MSGMNRKSRDTGIAGFWQLRYVNDEHDNSQNNVSRILKREIIFDMRRCKSQHDIQTDNWPNNTVLHISFPESSLAKSAA